MALLMAVVGFCVPACAQMGGRVAGGAVGQSLEVMTEEEKLTNFESIMTSPEVKRSAREVSEAAAAGIVAGLTGPDAQSSVAELTAGSGDAIRTNVGPAIAGMVRTTIDEAMTEILSEKREASVTRMASDVGGAMTASMMEEIGRGLEDDVVPAMLRSYENQVSPALARELGDPELRAALGALAHDLAHQAVLGTNEGIVRLADRDPALDRGALGTLGRRMTLGWAAGVALAMGLGLALVVLVILLLKGTAQRRHLEDDIRRREAMLMSLVGSTLMHDSTPEERREVLEQLRASGRSGGEPTTEAPPEEPPRGWRQRLAWRFNS